jgi:hypothetical protein
LAPGERYAGSGWVSACRSSRQRQGPGLIVSTAVCLGPSVSFSSRRFFQVAAQLREKQQEVPSTVLAAASGVELAGARTCSAVSLSVPANPIAHP